MANRIEQKLFLGKEVRVVNDEYVVLKDMFGALGRLREDGQIQSPDRNKVANFIDMGIICAGKTFTITSKSNKSRSRETQDVECIKIEDTSILFTQFEPTARVGKEAHDTWVEFMKFVKELLVGAKAHEMIIKSAEDYKSNCKQLEDYGSKNFGLVATNMKRIMARLIGVDGLVSKDELKYYKDQTTIDLLYAYDWCLSKMVDNYGIVEDLEEAYQMTKKLAKKKFPNSAL